jgi:hypothetical protein
MYRPLKIHATARAVPPRVLTNAELEAMVDTSDTWIRERTGIRERHIAAEDVATSDLAAEALVKACAAPTSTPPPRRHHRRDLDRRHPVPLDRLLAAAQARRPRPRRLRRQRRLLRLPLRPRGRRRRSSSRPRPRRPRRGDRRRGHEQGRRLDRPQHLRAVRRRRRRGGPRPRRRHHRHPRLRTGAPTATSPPSSTSPRAAPACPPRRRASPPWPTPCTWRATSSLSTPSPP